MNWLFFIRRVALHQWLDANEIYKVELDQLVIAPIVVEILFVVGNAPTS
jgi:hypothetical protein